MAKLITHIDTLLIASGNTGKQREFREMLGGDSRQWRYLSELSVAEPEETGLTFRANAMLKASYYANAANCWALADDSGLAVDALDGAPGVLSARWALQHNAGKGDAANNELLLKQLAHVKGDDRTARFCCVLALADPDGQIMLTAADHVEGVILHARRGNNGFGYDPLFLVQELQKTTAELEPEEKHRISHRGKALRRLKRLMEELEL